MRLLASLLPLLIAGCAVPYSVGTDTRTVPPGQLAQSAAFQFAAGQPDLDAEEGAPDPRATVGTLDSEVRFGLDPRSDAGVRLVGLSGVVATYRRQLGEAEGVALAGTAGAGVLALGRFAHAEATLLAAPPPAPGVSPYGGLRAQALLPLASDAPDAPLAVGVFGGLRLGRGDLAIFPELGVFYAPSDVFGTPDWIVVPSLTIHGDRLLEALGVGL